MTSPKHSAGWLGLLVLPYKIPVRIVSGGQGNTQDGIIHKCHGGVQLSRSAPLFFLKSCRGKVSMHGLIMNYNTCSIQKIECCNFPLASRRVRQSSDHTTSSMNHPWHATTANNMAILRLFSLKGVRKGAIIGREDRDAFVYDLLHIVHAYTTLQVTTQTSTCTKQSRYLYLRYTNIVS